MYRTLSEFRDSINQLIEQQGEDAICAGFVFTKEDVFEYDPETDRVNCFSTLFTHDVLADVGSCDYIYEQIGEVIEDAIRLRKKLPIYQDSTS